MIRIRRPLRYLVALALIAACDDSSGPANIATVEFSTASRTLALREPTILFASFRDANGYEIEGVSPAWRSSDPSIVSVDGNGHIFGEGLGGPVAVTVSAGGRSASIDVTVMPDDIVITPGATTLPLGTTRQLSGVALDFEGTPIEVPISWSSSHAGTASVDAVTGLLTSVASGTTVVTASAAGQSTPLSIEVGVPAPQDGHWTGTTLAVGNSPARPIEFDVVFGGVRNFKLVYSGQTGSCSYSVTVNSNSVTPIEDNSFTFPIGLTPITSAVSGSFESATSMTGSYGAFTFGDAPCPPPPSGIGQSVVTVNQATFSATKQ